MNHTLMNLLKIKESLDCNELQKYNNFISKTPNCTFFLKKEHVKQRVGNKPTEVKGPSTSVKYGSIYRTSPPKLRNKLF